MNYIAIYTQYMHFYSTAATLNDASFLCKWGFLVHVMVRSKGSMLYRIILH